MQAIIIYWKANHTLPSFEWSVGCVPDILPHNLKRVTLFLCQVLGSMVVSAVSVLPLLQHGLLSNRDPKKI